MPLIGTSGGLTEIEISDLDGLFDVVITSPSNGQSLTYNGTIWVNSSAGGGGTPGGSNTQLQYNNAGAFGGAAGLTYASSGTNVTITAQNTTDTALSVAGLTDASGNTGNFFVVKTNNGVGGVGAGDFIVCAEGSQVRQVTLSGSLIATQNEIRLSNTNLNSLSSDGSTYQVQTWKSKGVILNTQVSTGAASPALTVTGAANTALTASTENIGINFNLSATKQFATGALTTQREVLVQAPTYSAVGATTITTAATLAITGAPIAGSNVTITNPIAVRFTAGYSGAKALQLIMGGSGSSNSVFEILKSDGTTVALRFKDNLALEIPTGGLVATDLITDGSGNRVKLNLNNGVAGTFRQHNAATALGGSIYQLAGLSSTSTERVQGEINTSWADSTDATRKARVLYYAYDTAARECVRMEASGSAAMLGFFGASAVVQPANTVAIDTALTNLGLRASGGVANFDTDVKISTLGKALYIAEGSGGFSGSATLVLGTVAITIAGLTTADRAYVQRTVAGGTAGTGGLLAVCTANTLTITSIIIAGTIQALDTATVNYFITRPA